MNRFHLLLCLSALIMGSANAGEGTTHQYRTISGGDFYSAVRMEDKSSWLAPYALMERPVTNAQFADFLSTHPKWTANQIPAIFAGPSYLRHWSTSDPQHPVTHVTWYAAQAYCQSIGARLPSVLEWEMAAAASSTQKDARHNSSWRSSVANDGTPQAQDARSDAPNIYGIHGLHGAYWEWVDDQTALFGRGDRRGQADGNDLRYCGASSLTFTDPGNYAVVKRFSLLSALSPKDTLGNLGFRCARSLPAHPNIPFMKETP